MFRWTRELRTNVFSCKAGENAPLRGAMEPLKGLNTCPKERAKFESHLRIARDRKKTEEEVQEEELLHLPIKRRTPPSKWETVSNYCQKRTKKQPNPTCKHSPRPLIRKA